MCHCNFVLVAALRFAPDATIDGQPEFDAVASKGSGLDVRNNAAYRGENYILADEDKHDHTFVDDQITAIVGEKASEKLVKPKSVRADEVEEPNVDAVVAEELKKKFSEVVQYQEQHSEVLTDTVDPSCTTDLPNSLTTSVNTSQQVSNSPDSSTCTSDHTDSATSPNVGRDMSGSNSNSNATCSEGTSGVITDSYSGEDRYTATETAPIEDTSEQMSTTEGDSYSTSDCTSTPATSGQFSDCVPSGSLYSNNEISMVYKENCSAEESHAMSTLDTHDAYTSGADGKDCDTADDGSLERQSSGFHTAPQSAEDLHCSVTSEAKTDKGARSEVYETSIDNGKYWLRFHYL